MRTRHPLQPAFLLPILLCLSGTTLAQTGAPLQKNFPLPQPQAKDRMPPATLVDALAAYDKGDYAKALKMWKILAGIGEADAQYNLGNLYQTGKGVPQDSKQAFFWWQKAAAQGHAGGQYGLGYLYSVGAGVSLDWQLAHQWLNLAAKQRHVAAITRLGILYDRGQGVAKDQARAFEYFLIAAIGKHPNGQFRLGLHHALGAGLEKDYALGLAWVAQAAQAGLPIAFGWLARQLLDGKNLPADPQLALSFFILADTLSRDQTLSEPLREAIAEASSQLSSEQQTQAREMASAWQVGKALPGKAASWPRLQIAKSLQGETQCTMASYPNEAIKHWLEGSTLMLLQLDASGKILGAKIAIGSGWKILDQQALLAIKSCHFQATRLGEKAIAGWTTFDFTWRLQPETRKLNAPQLQPATCGSVQKFKPVRLELEQQIRLRFLVDEHGKPFDLTIEDSSGDGKLDQAASSFVQNCLFTPGTADGKPIVYPLSLRLTADN